MKPIAILTALLTLTACQPPPPCQDETCVANRMMLLNFVAAHPVVPYQIQTFTPAPMYVPSDNQGQITDLQNQVQDLQGQISQMRNN